MKFNKRAKTCYFKCALEGANLVACFASGVKTFQETAPLQQKAFS